MVSVMTKLNVQRDRESNAKMEQPVYISKLTSVSFFTQEVNQGNISQITIEQLNTNKKDVELKLGNIEARLTELDAAEIVSKIQTLKSKLTLIVSKIKVRVKTLEDENVNLNSKVFILEKSQRPLKKMNMKFKKTQKVRNNKCMLLWLDRNLQLTVIMREGKQ